MRKQRALDAIAAALGRRVVGLLSFLLLFVLIGEAAKLVAS